MSEQIDNHFKTHEVANINELLSLELALKSSACVIQTVPEKDQTGFLEEQGVLINILWSEITGTIKDIYGFRTSWNELVFVHSYLEPNVFKDKIVLVLKSTLDAKLKSKAIFSNLQGALENRLNEIEKMCLQLKKLNYWEKHYYPSYWENGKEIQFKST